MASRSARRDDITGNAYDDGPRLTRRKTDGGQASGTSTKGSVDDSDSSRTSEEGGTGLHEEYVLDDGSHVKINIGSREPRRSGHRLRRRHSVQDIGSAARFQDEAHNRDVPLRSILKHHDEGKANERNLERQSAGGRTHYDDWDDQVIFSPDDAIYRPRRWREKLEILEAQVLAHSIRPDGRLHSPLSPGHAERKLAHIRRVLYHFSDNLANVEASRFCSQAFNILVVDPSRYKVVNVVEIPFIAARRYVWFATTFVNDHNIERFYRVLEFLRYSSDFLASIGLEPEILEPWRGPPRIASQRNHPEGQEEAVEALLLHAMRAVAYVLDIGLVSFLGAHLEPFDEAYFHPSRFEGYKIPCDPDSKSTVILSERRFRCLDGFLGSNPAWVFEVHEAGLPTVLHRDYYKDFYLSTTPEQFANVWGPIWRAEAVHRHSSDKFMVADGFIVRWHRAPGDPELVPGEHLCHWTDDPKEVAKAAGFPRYVNIDRLLIGAGHDLHRSIECPTSSREIQNKLIEREYLRHLGPSPGDWYLGFSYLPIHPAGIRHARARFDRDLVHKRRTGVTCRSNICSSIIAAPLQNVGILSDLYGIEISGCTGNARRRELYHILSTKTMKSFLAPTFPWVLDEDRWARYCSVIRSSPDYKALEKSTTTDERRKYEKVIRLSMGIVKDANIPSGWDHVDALFSHHGHAYFARLPAAQFQWLGLLTDNLTSFSAPIIEVSCLECAYGRIDLFCHHPGRHLHWKPTGTVFSTTIVLNPCAYLPEGLKEFAYHHHVTKDMIQRVPADSTLDLGNPAGHLQILTCLRLRNGWGFVAERLPPFDAPARTVRNFIRRAVGEIDQNAVHREQFHEDASPGSCVPILVVSGLHDENIAHWLRGLKMGE